MVNKEIKYNKHHILGKSLVREYNVNIKENIHRMSVEKHNALHKLFWCLLTPKEQMREMYYIYESVLSNTAKELFDELVQLDDKDFYLSDLVKNGKHSKRM